jgi:hypothetical protein
MAISVDFDVPVHDYTEGWKDGSIYGDETPGAFAALRALMAIDAVFIHTTRPAAPTAAWLAERGGFETLADDGTLGLEFWDRRGVLLVTNSKYPAYAYVDDRAVPFTGDWNATIAAVAAHVPVLRDSVGHRPWVRQGSVDTATAHLRRSILRGDWRPGQRGPSNADLMTGYGLNLGQAQRVLVALQAEGLLSRNQGAPCVITHHATA